MLMGCFDLTGFVALNQMLGGRVELTTRKEAEKIRQERGYRKLLVEFENRLVKIRRKGEESYMGRGMLLKLLVDLVRPVSLLGD